MEDEDPDLVLEKEVDLLFDKVDKAAFFILEQILERVQNNIKPENK